MKNIQKKVQEFADKHDLNNPLEHRLLDLVAEIGEVSKEILKTTNYGKRTAKYKDEIKSELGDTVYSLIMVANYFKVDLEEVLNNALEKYEKRLKKGSAGSESD